MKNIVLIGFMGTGKTSTGRSLAQRLGFSFLDLDQKIEAEAGMSIPEMFEQYGEAYFRAREREMVARAAKRRNTVISTGGGTVKSQENMEALRAGGVVVCLQADVDTILQRTMTQGQRPVLDGRDAGDRRKAIKQLMQERAALHTCGLYRRYERSFAAPGGRQHRAVPAGKGCFACMRKERRASCALHLKKTAMIS